MSECIMERTLQTFSTLESAKRVGADINLARSHFGICRCGIALRKLKIIHQEHVRVVLQNEQGEARDRLCFDSWLSGRRVYDHLETGLPE